jgi:hypothetical protein
MSRIYNQIIYVLFKATDNKRILIGKDNYLFEPWYAEAYLNEPPENQKYDLYRKMDILVSLQKIIEKMGKSLFVIITPSKASIYPEYLPEDYRKYAILKNSGGVYSKNFYEYFVSHANNIGLRYFDYHDAFLNLKKDEIDIFSKGGTHWNGIAAMEFFDDFINVINKKHEKHENKIGMIKKIKSEPVWGDAFSSDNDLERLLNLLSSYSIEKILPNFSKTITIYKKVFPSSQYYSYHMETLSIPTAYRPDIFAIGGSFNWMWLSMVYGKNGWVDHGEKSIFGETYFSFYNSFIQKYPENIRVPQKADNFQDVLNKNILIVEFNEQIISPDAVQFKFVENLLNYIDTNKK